jgi:hypothetical protein
MSLLWPSDTLIGVKIFTIFITPLSISAIVYMVAYHDFSPSESILWPALILSLSITLGVNLLINRSRKNGSWEKTNRYDNFSTVKKIASWLTISFIVFLFTFINSYYAAPRLITSITGEENHKVDFAKVNKYGGKACGPSIELSTVSSAMFKICTNKKFYEDNKNIVFRVNLYFKKSSLGLIVTKIERIQ